MSNLPPKLITSIEPIRTALHGGRNAVLPLVGAGLSQGLQSWWSLLEGMIGDVAHESDREELTELLKADKYLEVATGLELHLGPQMISNAIKTVYHRPGDRNPPIPRPAVYDLVAALPVTHFLTTNYDPWLKDAVSQAKMTAPRVYVPTDQEAFSDLGPGSSPLVLHLHGDADRPSTCVLTERAYRKITHSQDYRQALLGLVSGRSLLLIGYSLSDPDIKLVLDEWQEVFGGGGSTRHWFLGTGLTTLAKRRLLDRGVMPIEYGPKDDHSLLPEVLRYLAAPPGAVGDLMSTGSASPSTSSPSTPAKKTGSASRKTTRSGASGTDPVSPLFRWLHLSDLHLGQRGGELWWQVGDEFHQSLLDMIGRIGPPHLVLLTGDLTNQAKPEEYELVDRFLDALKGWLSKAGASEPMIVAVPGNHDLARPNSRREARNYRIFLEYDNGDDADVRDLREQLWEERDSSPVAPLFNAYSDWFERTIMPTLKGHVVELNRSFFPGDLSLIVEPMPGFELGLVGLNATWAQYCGGDFEGKLHLPTAQFQAALPTSSDGPLGFFDRCDRALLLMHQPPRWLSERALKEFYSGVYPSGRFDACLFGHLHKGMSESVSLFGGEPRYYFQARSLFGLDRYETSVESRLFGYAFGSISAIGEVRIWPLRDEERGDGRRVFVSDQRYELGRDGFFVLRKGNRTPDDRDDQDKPARPAEVRSGRAPIVGQEDLDGYRQWALDRYGHLEMIGVGGGDLRFKLEDVYVPLRIFAREVCLDPDDRGPMRADCLREAAGDVELHRAFGFAGSDRDIIIFGEPGSGKTTALRKLLHQVLIEGAPSVGLEEGTVPLFLRLRALDSGQLRRPMAEFIQAELEARAPVDGFAPNLAARLWKRGRLLLLLDGLDEVADEGQRVQVAEYVRKTLIGTHARHIRCAVSCRYAGYGGKVRLGGGFLSLDVRPLDDDLIGKLVTQWFRQARRALAVDPARFAEAEAKGEQEALELIERLETKEYSNQQIRVLVSTPLLLTLLCVVVLRGGEIPRRRTEFYRECLRVLLGRWSEAKKIMPLLPPQDAISLLRPLAYRLHSEKRREDLQHGEFRQWLGPEAERLGRTLRRELDMDELLQWFHRGAGVLAEYATDRFGFTHLGLQEYLAALHIAREGSDLLVALAGELGDDWWKEVTLLLLGQPEHKVFTSFMKHVVVTDALTEEGELLRQCLEEAHEPDPSPFVSVLSNDEELPARRAAVLRLFADRNEPSLAEAAEGLQTNEDGDLSALAQQACQRAGLPVITLGEPAEVQPPDRVLVEKETGIRFLWVPGGRFEMGDPDWSDNPRHWVELSPFWLAETPVTNRQFSVFMEATRAKEPALWRDRRFSDPMQPVVGVSWDESVAFCEWLSRQQTTRERGLKVQLPSDSQWEFAARGTDRRKYPWGNEPPDKTRACYGLGYSEGKTAPVGSYPAGRGPFGNLDLAGNVWEWCQDWYHGDAHTKKSARDPVVLEPARGRVVRGGSFDSVVGGLRASCRSWFEPGLRDQGLGFRCCCAPSPPPLAIDLEI